MRYTWLSIVLPVIFLQLTVKNGDASPLVPENLRILQQGPEAIRVAIKWDAAPGAAGYRVYLGDQIQGETTGTIFVHSRLLPDSSYSFHVSSVDGNGAESDRARLDMATPPIPPIKPSHKINTVLLKYADYPSTPFTAQAATDRIYGASGSVNSYFKEVSYNKTGIAGTTYGWITLPNNASHYHTRGKEDGLWWGLDPGALLPDVMASVPAAAFEDVDAIVLFLHGTGDAGLSGGIYKYLSTRGDWAYLMSGLLHEIGHSLSSATGTTPLGHPAGWICPNADVGPSFRDPYQGGCEAWIYGYEPYDPMGAGTTRHFMSYHKWMLGMFDESNLAVALPGTVYNLEALETPGTGTKMLRIPLGGDDFYFVEYRKPLGYDGIDLVPNSNSPEGSPIDGVLVRVRIGTPGLPFTSLLPHGLNRPIVYNPGKPFLDPYRGISIEILSKDGNSVNVRVGQFNQPDLTVGSKPGRQIGRSQYSKSGQRQTLQVASRRLRTLRVYAAAYNAGQSADRIRLTGSRGNPHWKIKYFFVSPGRVNMTARAFAGLAITPLLQPGGKQRIQMDLRPMKKPRRLLLRFTGKCPANRSAMDQIRVGAAAR